MADGALPSTRGFRASAMDGKAEGALSRRGMKAVNFYALPRTQQVRLIDSFAGRFAPVPLLFVPGSPPGTWGWAAVSVLSMMTLVAMAQLGFGSLSSRLSVQGD